MPTVVVFAHPAIESYRVTSSDAVYANARAGTGTKIAAAPSFFTVGQTLATGSYAVVQEFLTFDTSALGAMATVTEVLLYIFSQVGPSPVTFNIEARIPWVATSPFENVFVDGALLSTFTLVADLSTSVLAVNSYAPFFDIALTSNLNLIGDTKLFLSPDLQRLNTAPVDASSTSATFDSPDSAGTDRDPKMLITYTLPVPAIGGGPVSDFRPMVADLKLASP